MADPVQVLVGREITEDNKADISTLAVALCTFRDFKSPTGRSYNIGKEAVLHLLTITKLLEDVASLQDIWSNSAQPATQAQLQNAISDIKDSLVEVWLTPRSYASAASRPPVSSEMEEKQIQGVSSNIYYSLLLYMQQ